MQKINETQRLIFQKGKQREFILEVKKKTNLTWRYLAKLVGISLSTLNDSYKREKCSISYALFKKLCKVSNLRPNKFLKCIKEVKDANWGRIRGGRIGGKKKKPNISKIKIKIPETSQKLAEFLGVLLGDGSISKTNYCIEISLNKESDRLYVEYVNDLIFNLFRILPRKIFVKNRKLIKLRIYSKELFNFIKTLNMPVGKETKKIPDWVSNYKNLMADMLRGLFDTDGSLYFSSRRCILNFSCYSSIMRKQIDSYLNTFGIPVSRTGNNINVSSLWKIKRFMEIIGSSNVKNVIKFLEYINNKKTVRTEDLKKYFKLYESIKAPYKYGRVI